MARRSIQRPLLIYALFFMLALAISVVTIGSLSLLRTARAAQREMLAAHALRIAETASWPSIRSVFPERDDRSGIGVVGPGATALGLTLADARLAAARPDRDATIGAVPLRSPGDEAYVVYRTEPAMGFAIAQREIRTLLAFALIIAVAFGALMAVLVSRLVLSPLGDLHRAAAGIDLADPVLGTGIETPNEVAEVAQTFRRTIRKLQEERENIARARDELELMQAGLIRASKLASVGRLAAGVAHEIGNPLSAVLGYLDLIRRGLGPEDQRDVLERSEKELRRIHDTIKKLLTYARADEAKEAREPFATGQVVLDTIALLRGHPALREVQIVDEVDPKDIVDAFGRPTALQQVLMNLMINAGHAGGTEVRLRRENGGDRVALLVIDNGSGISPDVIEHIFDPFFTTKAPGEGTGLGLAVSRSLVEAMDGALEVSSSPGEGATFTIRLPKAPSRS